MRVVEKAARQVMHDQQARVVQAARVLVGRLRIGWELPAYGPELCDLEFEFGQLDAAERVYAELKGVPVWEVRS
jgi:hypothetical protein